MEDYELKQPTLFDAKRELIAEEYANLREKQKGGYLNADFYRKNMFAPKQRGSLVKYKKPKIIYSDDKMDILISNELHQRHADLLSLIHSDREMATKPHSDGSFTVYLSFYKLAKLMGYRQPEKRAWSIKGYLDDLRKTDFIIRYKKPNGRYVEEGDKICGRYVWDDEFDRYCIEFNGKSAKILAYTTGIRFDKELTHRIVNIKNARLKAIIRYMLSNKPNDKGVTFSWFLKNIFRLDTKKREDARDISNLKKELRENHELLASFNLIYNEEEQKVYYLTQLNSIQFALPLQKRRTIPKILNQDLMELEPANPYSQYIGKKFKSNDMTWEVLGIEFTTIEKQEVYIVSVLDINNQNAKMKTPSLERLAEVIREYEKSI